MTLDPQNADELFDAVAAEDPVMADLFLLLSTLAADGALARQREDMTLAVLRFGAVEAVLAVLDILGIPSPGTAVEVMMTADRAVSEHLAAEAGEAEAS